MMCDGPRHFCVGCRTEMIHRDHRRWYESASPLGQIIWRLGPAELTTGDIDMSPEHRMRDGRVLLRLLKHEQPESPTDKKPQATVQRHLAQLMDHAIRCEDFKAIALHPESGFYRVQGAVEARAGGRREVVFHGPQVVTHVLTGETCDFSTMRGLNDWLVGGEPWTRRMLREPRLP